MTHERPMSTCTANHVVDPAMTASKDHYNRTISIETKSCIPVISIQLTLTIQQSLGICGAEKVAKY